MRARFATVAVLALGLTAAKSDPFAGRTAGPPAQCVDTSVTMTGPSIYDDNSIVINPGGKRMWKAKVRGQCPGLRPFNTLIVERWGSQICRNDRFQVLQQGMSIPSQWCFFDGFVPYERGRK